MRKRDQLRFKKILTTQREQILKHNKSALSGDMELDPDDFPDEIDTASSEANLAFTGRLRERERGLLEVEATRLHHVEAILVVALAALELGVVVDHLALELERLELQVEILPRHRQLLGRAKVTGQAAQEAARDPALHVPCLLEGSPAAHRQRGEAGA